jgi:hypothetical protein
MDEDIYIVDTRNADFRTPQPTTGVPGRVGTGVRTVVAQPVRSYSPQTYAPPPYGQPQFVYAAAPQPTAGTTLFGRITGGQLVDLVAQIFAALMPLPGAPVATADASTDVQNLMTYSTALAQYAKRDEQVRTLGNLVTKLLG